MDFDHYLKQVQALIDKHGWTVQGVGSNPPYAYTVALSARYNLPEIVVMGLPFQVATTVLNRLARRMVENDFVPLADTTFNEVFEGFDAKFVELSPAQVAKHLRIACLFAPQTPKAWQLIWPDPQGRFAGEEGADDRFAAMQNLAFVDAGPA